MKKLSIALFLLAFAMGCKSTNSPSDFDKEQAHNMVKNFYRALSLADSTLMDQVLSDEFIMYEHEVLWNQDSLLSLMAATKGRIWRVDEIEFHVNGNIAHTYYYNESDNPIGRSWYESMLFKKEDGEWKIRFMQSTKRYLK